jgi:hypothetical protein
MHGVAAKAYAIEQSEQPLWPTGDAFMGTLGIEGGTGADRVTEVEDGVAVGNCNFALFVEQEGGEEARASGLKHTMHLRQVVLDLVA